jgi:hypothetical protein
MEPIDQDQKFFFELSAAYEKLKESPEDWKDEIAEREIWAVTLQDGLESES